MKQKSAMGDFATVFGYYLKKEMRSKVYLIVTILLCVISLSSCFLLNLFTQEGDKQPLYVVDRTGMFQEAMETTELPTLRTSPWISPRKKTSPKLRSPPESKRTKRHTPC